MLPPKRNFRVPFTEEDVGTGLVLFAVLVVIVCTFIR